MVNESDDCLKCEEHKAWEERMKVLDRVPSILSWMNYMKGALAVIIALLMVGFPVFYSHIMTIRSETALALEKQDKTVRDTRDMLTTQVMMLNQNASAISKDVAVFVARSEMKHEALANDVAILKAEGMKVKRAN